MLYQLQISQQYGLFSPPPPMYSDEEIEAWGELYCKFELYARGEVPFVSFMALSPDSRRRSLRVALNHPRSGLPASLPPVKGGEALPIPRLAGDTSGRCVGADNTRGRGRRPHLPGPVTRHLSPTKKPE